MGISRNKVSKFIEVLELDEEWLIEQIERYSVNTDPSQNKNDLLKLGLVGGAGLIAGGMLLKNLFKTENEDTKSIERDNETTNKSKVNQKIYVKCEEDIKHLKSLYDRKLIDEKTYKKYLDEILSKAYRDS